MDIPRCVKVYRVPRESYVEEYKSLYRYDKENLQSVADHFLGEYSENRGGGLSNEQKGNIFLRYFSDQGFQNVVAEDVGVFRV